MIWLKISFSVNLCRWHFFYWSNCFFSFWQRSIRSFANDDRHVMVKHSTIYPSPEELEAVQNMVSTVECALKHVSDWLDETNKGTKSEGETEVKKDETVENYSKWVDWPCDALLEYPEKLESPYNIQVLGFSHMCNYNQRSKWSFFWVLKGKQERNDDKSQKKKIN